MAYIRSLKGGERLDSRGFPTIEVQLTTDQGVMTRALIPSGASTGSHEALELRDGDAARYFGKGVQLAVAHVNGPIAQILVGEHVFDQARLDLMMIAADGTANKEHFGANAILAASLALARAGAATAKLPLYRYLGGCHTYVLPCPMINIINGGAHADNSIDFQEFMIRPVGAASFSEAVRWGSEVFHTLKRLLKERGHTTAVGDEGGFAPDLTSNEEALNLIVEAIETAGFEPGSEISLALDCAASEFFDPTTKLYVEKKREARGQSFAERSAEEQIGYLSELVEKFPIDSIEDPLHEEDWAGWRRATVELGGKVQLVGDDLFVTNPTFLSRGIREGIANSVLIKINQIGTLTETFETIKVAQTHGFTTVISHRSGETEDSAIADISVAVNAGQIKTGSLCRSERVVKYNRLLAIEEGLGTFGRYCDSNRYKI